MTPMRNEPGTVGPVMHYVVEINVKQVFPAVKAGTGNEGKNGDRYIDDICRVVTKASSLEAAVRKAKRILDIESDVDDLDDITGPNFLVGKAEEGER